MPSALPLPHPSCSAQTLRRVSSFGAVLCKKGIYYKLCETVTTYTVLGFCECRVGRLLPPVFIATEKIGDKVERNADNDNCFPHKHSSNILD